MGSVLVRHGCESCRSVAPGGRHLRTVSVMPWLLLKVSVPGGGSGWLSHVRRCPCVSLQDGEEIGMGVSPMLGVPVPYSESHPFAWFPLAGQRHAIDQRDRNVPLGKPMRCLCGITHPPGADGDMEWLWHTCERCWEETCRIVGVRGRG
ncbi:MAG: zinc finger protein [Pseudonocardiaceae bacterium]